MSIGEEELAGRIVRHLDRGLADLDAGIGAKLRSARESAVERLEPQPAWSLALAGARGPRTSGRQFNPVYVFSVAAFVLSIYGVVLWQQQQHIEDPIDIDAKLLSGDLPIDAYLDKGLDTWLKR
ncbi:MAG: DUF3619 family protein [Burkholderiales bacterium]|nr:DUF3619 family protein [Burkholderiales bacterium]